METNVIYQGKFQEQTGKIEPGSADLILTDPPYGIAKDMRKSPASKTTGLSKNTWDNVIEPMDFYNISNRVLRTKGRLILFSSQPYTNKLLSNQINDIPYSYTMIWLKDHFANSLKANNAPLNKYEEILVFTKRYDTELKHPLRGYFKKIFEHIGKTKTEIIDIVGGKADHVFRYDSKQFWLCNQETYQELINKFDIDKVKGFKNYEELEKISKEYKSTFNAWGQKDYKLDVLEYAKDYDGHHPTQKPVALLGDLIKTFSKEGDLVVDLTAGSGSTGVAAKNCNREYILIEKDKEYYEIAQERVE